MRYYYTHEQVNNLLDKYAQKGGNIYTIAGCLVDNYVCIGEGLKTIVIREYPLNEWSSVQMVRKYNSQPKKYLEIANLFDDGEEDKATELFFK